MQYAALYLITAIVFLAVDIVALRYLLSPIFRSQLGDNLLEVPRMGAAVVFYLFYVLGIVIFVSIPALKAGAPWQAFWMGALLGALAYGTYEFTNYATLRDWSIKLVIVDGLWGTFLTGFSAWFGVILWRNVF